MLEGGTGGSVRRYLNSVQDMGVCMRRGRREWGDEEKGEGILQETREWERHLHRPFGIDSPFQIS